MKKIDLNNINNLMVLDSEENEEFEGLCGTEKGILWEDSLEQFFEANNINQIGYKENEWIILKQGNLAIKFKIFLGKEGSSFISEHIDFNYKSNHNNWDA